MGKVEVLDKERTPSPPMPARLQEPQGKPQERSGVENPAAGATRGIVIVDAGHGGKDGGAVANGLIEKKLTLDVCGMIREKLLSRGFSVVMTRSGDSFLDLESRSAVGWKYPEALFVSVHFNTAPATTANGVETYYTASAYRDRTVQRRVRQLSGIPDDWSFVDRRGSILARLVQESVCRATGMRDRGARKDQFYVTKKTPCPAILVEAAFMTNRKEAAQLRLRSHREKIAEGIVAGIERYTDLAAEDALFGFETQPPETSRITTSGDARSLD